MGSAAKYSYNLCVDNSEEKSTVTPATPAATNKSPSSLLMSPQVQTLKTVMGRLFATSPSQESKPIASSTLNDTIDLTSSGTENDDYSMLFDVNHTDQQCDGNSNIEVNLYETVLEDENRQLKEFLNGVLPTSENPKDDVISLYKSRNAILLIALKESEAKVATCMKVQEENEKLYKNRIARLERQIVEIHRGHEMEMDQIIRENQRLIDEIINSQIEEIEAWKRQFRQECNINGDGKRNSADLLLEYEVIALPPPGEDSLPLQLLQKFRELSPATQGVMAVGIGIIVLVVGYYSWPFISWAWPRLNAFATRFEVAATGAWIYTFIQSHAFQDFVRAWEQGKPFTPILVKNFGPEIVRNITRLAPSLLRVSFTTSTSAGKK